MIILCDIDGTVADNSHRLHFIARAKRLWHYFYSPENVAKDEPILTAKEALPGLLKKARQFHFLTGRPERTRLDTADWIYKHFNLVARDPATTPPESGILLFMRGDTDFSKAVDYKERRIQKILEELKVDHGEEVFFIDDDERNLEMYAKYGTCLLAPACWGRLRLSELTG